MKPYKLPFLFACITIVCENALEISLPFLMDTMLTYGLTHNENGTYSYDQAFILMMGAIMLGFAVTAFFLGLIATKMTAISGRGFGYELRKQEYKKIQEFSFNNLNQFRLNSLITRMTTDIQIISDTFCQVLRPMLRAPFQLVFAITFAYFISTRLSVVFYIVIPTLAVIMTILVLASRPKFYALQGALDRINSTTDESLIAMKLIRANAKKGYEEEKFASVNKQVRHIALGAHTLTAVNQPVIHTMIYCCITGILLIGGQYTLKNNEVAMVDHIVSFLSYVNQTLASLMMLSNVFMMFTRSSASFSRVSEVFESNSEIIDKKDSNLTLKDGSITFSHVNFKYSNTSKQNVLSDINVKINSGEFIGILGETGSGKSTLVYLIDRFYDINEGALIIGNHPIQDYSLKQLREDISISFQAPRLFSGTIRDNLLWGNPKASEEELIQACKTACCYDFIQNLNDGLDTMISQGGNNVSGGQRQRLCIARALLKNPKILILDDSFSALDRITENQLKKNLKKYHPDMTKLVISQKTSTIMDSDKIIVMNHGTINNIGNHDYLMKHDSIYRDIHTIQSEGK